MLTRGLFAVTNLLVLKLRHIRTTAAMAKIKLCSKLLTTA